MKQKTKNLENEFVQAVEQRGGKIPLDLAVTYDDRLQKSKGYNPKISRAVGLAGIYREIAPDKYLVTERTPEGEYIVVEHNVIAGSFLPKHYFIEDGELYEFNLSRSGVGTRHKLNEPTLKDLKNWVVGATIGELLQLSIVGKEGLDFSEEALIASLSLPLGIIGAGVGIYLDRKHAWNKFKKFKEVKRKWMI